MTLVFAAITPHPPVLLPTTDKKARVKLAATESALSQLEQELYLARPQVVIIISPHTSFFAEAFSINAHNVFSSHFEEFGDVQTKETWHGDPDLAAMIAHNRNHDVPIQLVSEEVLDHGASIPLYFLTRQLRKTKILPIGFSQLSTKDHLDFGECIKEAIMNSGKRVAVIASGDLSHTLSSDSPGGYNPQGKQFDETIQKLLFSKNTVGITQLDPHMVKGAEECGYRSILILLGALKNTDYSFKTLTYEAPFGVGYLTGVFHF